MIMRLFFTAIILSACSSQDTSQLDSYQTRDNEGYVYLLTHTQRLDEQASEARQIAVADFNNYGQCLYKVASETKLRLHRPAEMQAALNKAEMVNSAYLPLNSIWDTMKKDRDLQTLYTSERHWLLPTAGAFIMTMPVLALDSFLHQANSAIVDASQKYIDTKKGSNTLRAKAYEAIHLTAKAEHTADEFMHKSITIGKVNPLKRARKFLLESKPSQGLADFFKKYCIGARKVIFCTVAYLASFNSMYLGGMTFGSDMVANKLGHFFNKETEEAALHNLLGDIEPMGKVRSTNKDVVAALEKLASKDKNLSSQACPTPQALLASAREDL